MAETQDAPFEIGRRFVFRKTVGESDVYLFAGITGDFSPNHVDEEAMRNHGQSDAMRAAMAQFGPLMAQPPNMRTATPVAALGLP